jgi:hypothetical protein
MDCCTHNGVHAGKDKMITLLGLNLATGVLLLALLVWKRRTTTPVEKTDFSGLKEYKTKTGTSLYCLQGGGQKKSVEGNRYGTVS